MVKKLDVNFGKILKELRETKGISQEELGFRTDLHRTYISLLERGLRNPTLATIFKLAKQLETTPSKMIRKLEE